MGLQQEAYRFCFAGAALPPELQKRFASSSLSLQRFIPDVELVYPRVPGHVTSLYAGDLTPAELRDVATEIAYNSKRLRGRSLNVTGEMLTNPVRKKRIILKVEAPDEWYEFCEDTYDAVGDLACRYLRPYVRRGHLSMAKYKDPIGRVYCKQNLGRIAASVGRVQGQIPLTEIVGWGMDPGSGKMAQIERFRVDIAMQRPEFYNHGYPISVAS